MVFAVEMGGNNNSEIENQVNFAFSSTHQIRLTAKSTIYPGGKLD